MQMDPTLSLRTRLKVSTVAKAARALSEAGYKPRSRSELLRISMEVFVHNLELSGKAPKNLSISEAYDIIRDYVSPTNKIELGILFKTLSQDSISTEGSLTDYTLTQSLEDAFKQARESITEEE